MVALGSEAVSGRWEAGSKSTTRTEPICLSGMSQNFWASLPLLLLQAETLPPQARSYSQGSVATSPPSAPPWTTTTSTSSSGGLIGTDGWGPT